MSENPIMLEVITIKSTSESMTSSLNSCTFIVQPKDTALNITQTLNSLNQHSLKGLKSICLRW